MFVYAILKTYMSVQNNPLTLMFVIIKVNSWFQVDIKKHLKSTFEPLFLQRNITVQHLQGYAV